MRLLIAVLGIAGLVGLLVSDLSRASGQSGLSVLDDTKPKKDPGKDEKKKDPNELEPEVIKGELTKNDPFDAKRPKCHHKVHVVKMMAGYTYTIDMKAATKKDKDEPVFDTYLRLEDAAGKQLDENDDYITTDSQITYKCDTAGEYRVICTTFDDGFTGAYTLTVGGYKGGPKKKGDGIVVLNINGILDANDPLDAKRMTSHAKMHFFNMQANKTYQIDMISTQFDSYLRLEDLKGNQLDEDDDSGGNLNARIIFTAKTAGVYRIIATTFGPNQTGTYELRVTQK